MLKEDESNMLINNIFQKHDVCQESFFNCKNKHSKIKAKEYIRMLKLEEENVCLKNMYTNNGGI